MGKMPQVLPYSGAMLAIVARSASARFARPSPKYSTNLSTTPFLRSISVTVSTRSVAVAPALSWPVSLKPMTCGISMVTGWPSIAAPAQHAQAVDHRSVRVSADHGVRIHLVLAVRVAMEHDAAEVLEVHLVHDAGVRRHHLEVAERGLAPAQERIALAVALELDLVVRGQRARMAVVVDLHRMIDDQLGGIQRIDALGIAAELLHGFAHGGEIDHAGRAGEVLHDDARRREIDFIGRRGLRIPVEHRVDVVLRDVHAVFVAQQVLEQDLE